jgi:EpsI family protein
MKKHYVAVLVLLVAGALTHLRILDAQAGAARQERQRKAVAFNIPERIGSFRQMGTDQEIDPHVLRVLETSNIVIRNYIHSSGRPVQLTIVYAGSTRRSLHFPEVCLVGNGWDLQAQRGAHVGILFSARQLILARGDSREAVLYWFKTGDSLTGNYFLNAWHWARNQLTSGGPTSAMIKLTTPIRSGRRDAEKAAFAMLDEFAVAFYNILLDVVP